MSLTRSTTWHDQPALALESANVSVVMVPGMGAKIVSLLDKRDGFEWLAGPMTGRQVAPVPYGAPFTEQDMSGWDEMFPTIVACPYPGPGPLNATRLPDHGEAWALPWTVSGLGGDQIGLTLTGQALPYRLMRTAAFASPDDLALRYTLENLSDDPMPYIWAAHPQFVAGSGCDIVLPPEITRVVNTIPDSWGWGPPGTPFDWPEAAGMDGPRVRLDRAGPPSLHRARKFFALPDAHPSHCTLIYRDPGRRLGLEWDPAAVPYLGLWVDEGAINDRSVVAPEPTTGWYDDLSLAWQNQHVKVLPPRGVHEWTLTVRLDTGGDLGKKPS